MNYFYFDTTGNREWENYKNAHNILDSDVPINSEDTIFIHFSDFYTGVVKTNYFPGVKRFIKDILKTHYIKNRSTTVIFISGGIFKEDKKELILKKIINHDKDKIIFIEERIEHYCRVSDLENIISPILRKIEAGTYRNREENNLVNQLQTIFMMLWQAYCLTTIKLQDCPDFMKIAKEIADKVIFNDDYWKPILIENRINSLLLKYPPPNCNLEMIKFKEIANWSTNSIELKKIADQYVSTMLGFNCGEINEI